MHFDLVSDLHIDFWDDNHHFDWLQYQQSDILVVAGDISDYHDQSINYLIDLKRYYKTIMFVDGNHEHQPNYLDIGPDESSQQWDGLASVVEGIHFLGKEPLTLGNTRFIGRMGWWCFSFGEPYVTKEESLAAMFDRTEWTQDVADQQLACGKRDVDMLSEWVLASQWDIRIENIVMVTHTLPDPVCISWDEYPPHRDFTGLYGNTNYKQVWNNDINKKMRYWLFGHNHDQKSIKKDQCTMLSNPRGRPKDYNRENYSPKHIQIG